jgi:hypothetical protein
MKKCLYAILTSVLVVRHAAGAETKYSHCTLCLKICQAVRLCESKALITLLFFF